MPKSPDAANLLLELVSMSDSLADVDDHMGNTDCPEGCYVEPDGKCAHGYESAALTAQLI